jgi:hypothetical protein
MVFRILKVSLNRSANSLIRPLEHFVQDAAHLVNAPESRLLASQRSNP